VWPSTVAYMAQLMIHRYAMLGVLDAQGYPVSPMGILQIPADASEGASEDVQTLVPMAGARCPECGNASVIRRDGCDFCTACGHIGACG
jgi:ribonucleoside-diphosphate reductase alpha chain